jgi:hypothetical protein
VRAAQLVRTTGLGAVPAAHSGEQMSWAPGVRQTRNSAGDDQDADAVGYTNNALALQPLGDADGR